MRYAAIILLLIFFSCKKDKDKITVSGVVSDFTDGHPLSGLRVEVQAKLVGTSTYQSSFSTLQMTTSGAGGEFSVSFDNQKATAYRIRVTGTNYRATEHEFSPEQISEGSYSYQLRMPANGWIMLKVINQLPAAAEDEITIRCLNLPTGLSGTCSASSYHYIGLVNDTIPTCFIPGGMTIVIERFLLTHYQYDTLVIPVNDTLVHTILF
jgi:hypothetical protein